MGLGSKKWQIPSIVMIWWILCSRWFGWFLSKRFSHKLSGRRNVRLPKTDFDIETIIFKLKERPYNLACNHLAFRSQLPQSIQIRSKLPKKTSHAKKKGQENSNVKDCRGNTARSSAVGSTRSCGRRTVGANACCRSHTETVQWHRVPSGFGL